MEGRIRFLDSDQSGNTSLVGTLSEYTGPSIDYPWDVTTKKISRKNANKNNYGNEKDQVGYREKKMVTKIRKEI